MAHSTDLVENLEPNQDELVSGADYGYETKLTNSSSSANLTKVVVDEAADLLAASGAVVELDEVEKKPVQNSTELSDSEADLELDELTYTLENEMAANQSSTVETIIINNLNDNNDVADDIESTQMPSFDDDEGSGDSEQVITIGVDGM